MSNRIMDREPTVEEARKMHREMGFRPYSGTLLEGPRTVIPLGDARYPQQLALTPNPPEELYCIGDPEALRAGLAVVGARKATPYGKACVRKFAGRAAQRGIVVVSGGARGCDSEAHRAALDAGRQTVAVLGGGCDQLYPPGNFSLFQRIIEQGGAVISERPWDHPALPWTFRQRNRIIAGLCRAVLIVEAKLPSGTFSTADEALAADRDVLVVPGAITSPTSAGSNRLLYQGAYPVVDDETFDDALASVFGRQHGDELAARKNPYAPLVADDVPRDVLLEALIAEPLRMDAIMRTVGPMVTGSQNVNAYLQTHLAELERDGLIARFPDGRYGPAKA